MFFNKKIIVLSGLFVFQNHAFANDFIQPISREMGSRTRGAFTEIFKIQKEIKNKKIDATTQQAEITNSTGVMISSIQNQKNAIGYISLGSLNKTVKALKIDGVAASVDNIKNGSYQIQRPFLVVVKKENILIEDFLEYATHQNKIIEKTGYIPNNTQRIEYKTKQEKGKIVIAGSSSVSPLMEKLVENYKKENPNAIIEIQTSDSTMGANLVAENIADIGMLSRDLKESEKKKGLKERVLAIDGLAVIVNNDNPIENISKENVKDIFLGNIKTWLELK